MKRKKSPSRLDNLQSAQKSTKIKRYVKKKGQKTRKQDSVSNMRRMDDLIDSPSKDANLSTIDPMSDFTMIKAERDFYERNYERTKDEELCQANELQEIQNQRQLAPDVKEFLNDLVRKISILEVKLKERANLERCFPSSNTPGTLSNSARLVGLFHDLKYQLTKLLVEGDTKKYRIKSLSRKSADLDDLLSVVFGQDALCKTPNSVPTSTFNELIQTLTGASIYSWIFRADFKTHHMYTTPILDEYRRFITCFRGEEELYDLDIAVHRSIIESEGFERAVVPAMSGVLVSRLIQALQFLFHGEMEPGTTEKLQSLLGPVFELAVQARAESLLVTNHFELIWPVAGSAVNEEETEVMNSNSVDNEKIVRLPLVPGLLAFPKKKTIVEYSGFERGTVTETRRDYVVKALVLSL